MMGRRRDLLVERTVEQLNAPRLFRAVQQIDMLPELGRGVLLGLLPSAEREE